MKHIILFILVLITNLESGKAQNKSKYSNAPNIILLVTDDHRWDALGAYGNDIVQTPNIDQMAKQGVLFENMFVTSSICAPSRATIMTGEYPSRHGVHDFSTNLTQSQLQQTYMGQLKDAGYHLGVIGKWGVGTPPENFMDFDGTIPGDGFFHRVNGKKQHHTRIIGDQVVEFLKEYSSGTPFILTINFKAAHVQDSYDVSDMPYPYDPETSDLYGKINIPMPDKSDPKYYEQLPNFLKNSENRMRWAVRFWGTKRAQSSMKGYYRLISGVDREIGRIHNELQKEGLSENTVILFTSDNGMFMGEYGWTGKWFPHEESIRVPLIIYDPRLKKSQRGKRLQQMALNLDIAPTILDLANTRNKADMQGRSLVPLLQGVQKDWRTAFFYEHLFEHPRIPKTEAVRTKQWKYIRYVDQEPVYEQLFDLRNEPKEVENLMLNKDNKALKLKMRKKWKEIRETVK